MTRLTEAMETAEARKVAAFGDDASGLVGDDPLQSRAIFSGFDLDHDELTEMANRVGVYFNAALLDGMMGPRPLFSAAWTDGFLIGLLLASSLEAD